MAEVKNSFLSSRMNKDLDDRLIPNGEYRDAVNIQVGKSQDGDVGALENMYGNHSLPLMNETAPDIYCIGAFPDTKNNKVYLFLTNYTDPNPTLNTLPPSDKVMKITVYDLNGNGSYNTLVEGTFLNFAKNKECAINGVNLIESLLFWVDNRNQPRKINVNNPLGYYTTEEQISVAKYAPVFAPLLYKEVDAIVQTGPDSLTPNKFTVTDGSKLDVGMTMVTPTSNKINANDFVYITEINGNDVTVYSPLATAGPLALTAGDKIKFLISTMSDQSDNPAWPGDPAFLTSKYVRFSYRLKFDDNEYSIMAPFTQIAYIPKQKGYFIDGNEDSAYRSTVVKWMENNINNVKLIIQLPDICKRIANSYKIQSIDILYKESDDPNVKVLQTIPVADIASDENIFSNTNIYEYTYQSQKPYKTLTSDQITRVYDKVPVRALAQEVISNRIVYGNYRDKYVAPGDIYYNVSIQPKSDIYTSFVEYPNHTVKQNRNYQVGWVFADKTGRQTSVMLSSSTTASIQGDITYGGSTIYSPYKTTGPDVKDWNGDALVVLVNSTISSTKNIPAGTPGLYANPTAPNGFTITFGERVEVSSTEFKYNFISDNISGIPVIGDSLRGEYIDYVKVLNVDSAGAYYSVTTDSPVNVLYEYDETIGTNIKYSYTINPTGWYSYKIVVRQQEQEYYNAYLPGLLNGYPKGQTYGSEVNYTVGVPSLANGINTTTFPVNETNKIAHTVLINDNINKIPRDLSEVGPDQKQYRSSVELFGRVQNISNEIVVTTLGYVNSPPTITYYIDDVPDYINIKAGDTIYPTYPNDPDTWKANTAVKSNDINVDTGIGTITMSIENDLLVSPINFSEFKVITASNIQYYPPRKADVVSAIASSGDFNFLETTVQNQFGTASSNFYQLQTHPLIGRISTVKEIGATAVAGMVPYLSVYETKPDYSLLDIFWETATTGYISDINYDVTTGYDGPIDISEFTFAFFENQDPTWPIPLGGNTITGDPKSPYITSNFFPINNGGSFIVNTTATLSVVDLNGVDRSSEFVIERENTAGEFFGSYRIRIKKGFEFTHNANLNASFVFAITFTWLEDGSVNTVYYDGKLANVDPAFDHECGYYNITINGGVPDGARFSSWQTYCADSTSDSTSGTVTITGGPITFKATADGETSGVNVDATITINGITLFAHKHGIGHAESSSSIILPAGTYPYSVDVTVDSGFGCGGILIL